MVTMMVVRSSNFHYGFLLRTFPGLTEPVLIRLDVDSKLSDQIKVEWQEAVWLDCINAVQDGFKGAYRCLLQFREVFSEMSENSFCSSSALIFPLAGG